jgi:hypothetical protein
MKKTQTEKLYKHNDLFTPAEPYIFNACVGSNGGPYGFYEYAQGYFDASFKIVNSLLNDPSMLDYVIYPLVFSYRHAIELSLKDLAEELPKIYGKTGVMKKTHSLIDNWGEIRPFLKGKTHFDSENVLVDQVDAILSDFLRIDSTGMVFRYPVDKKDRLHLEELAQINMIVFAESMIFVQETFESWMSTVRLLNEE